MEKSPVVRMRLMLVIADSFYLLNGPFFLIALAANAAQGLELCEQALVSFCQLR